MTSYVVGKEFQCLGFQDKIRLFFLVIVRRVISFGQKEQCCWRVFVKRWDFFYQYFLVYIIFLESFDLFCNIFDFSFSFLLQYLFITVYNDFVVYIIFCLFVLLKYRLRGRGFCSFCNFIVRVMFDKELVFNNYCLSK